MLNFLVKSFPLLFFTTSLKSTYCPGQSHLVLSRKDLSVSPRAFGPHSQTSEFMTTLGNYVITPTVGTLPPWLLGFYHLVFETFSDSSKDLQHCSIITVFGKNVNNFYHAAFSRINYIFLVIIPSCFSVNFTVLWLVSYKATSIFHLSIGELKMNFKSKQILSIHIVIHADAYVSD